MATRDYAQLLAARAKIQEKRLVNKDAKATKSRAEVKTGYATLAQKIRRADDRAMRDGYINAARGHIIGGKWLHYDAKRPPHLRKSTGIAVPFSAEISPGNYMMRTEWRKARHSSGFHKILKPRKHRLKRQTHWRVSGHFIVPK
jgi:hypothetical protein